MAVSVLMITLEPNLVFLLPSLQSLDVVNREDSAVLIWSVFSVVLSLGRVFFVAGGRGCKYPWFSLSCYRSAAGKALA